MPFNIDLLNRRPHDHERWTRCFYPLDDKLVANQWDLIRYLPPIHFVGETHDGLFHEVAVCEFSLAWLLDNDFVFCYETDMAIRYDVSMPKNGEVNLYGSYNAVERAELRFLRQAVTGITSRRGPGIDLYYYNYPCQPGILEAIQWATLTRDINVSAINRIW